MICNLRVCMCVSYARARGCVHNLWNSKNVYQREAANALR